MNLSKRSPLQILADVSLVTGIIIALASICVFIYKQDYSSPGPVDNQIFGDLGSFLSGTVGSLWSLVSIIYFVIALREQRRQLENNELTQEIARFENTFFKLIELHLNTVKTLCYSFNGSEIIGVQVFQYWKDQLDKIGMGIIWGTKRTPSGGNTRFLVSKAMTPVEYDDYFKQKYPFFYAGFSNSLTHYFRQLFHIINYVHKSKAIKFKEKKVYLDFLIGQLSQNELHAIAFNSLNFPKFAFLIKLYDILENFDSSVIENQIAWQYITDNIKTTIESD